MKYASGASYEGFFKNNQREGQGVIFLFFEKTLMKI